MVQKAFKKLKSKLPAEKDWTQVHQWADGSGLDVIASLATQQEHQNDGSGAWSQKWDPRNALDLISFSDHMGYNGSWQLGYGLL